MSEFQTLSSGGWVARDCMHSIYKKASNGYFIPLLLNSNAFHYFIFSWLLDVDVIAEMTHTNNAMWNLLANLLSKRNDDKEISYFFSITDRLRHF